jgi:hypothetical protein
MCPLVTKQHAVKQIQLRVYMEHQDQHRSVRIELEVTEKTEINVGKLFGIY